MSTSRQRALAAIVVLVLTLAAAGVAILVSGSEDQSVAVDAMSSPPPPGISNLDQVLSERVLPAQAGTGEGFFVFGGIAPYDDSRGPQQFLLNDGALVDATDPSQADQLPPSPFDPPLFAPRAVATTAAVVVVGISCNVIGTSSNESDPLCDPGSYAAGTFSLADRSWQVVEAPPGLQKQGGYVWELGVSPDDEAIFAFAPADTEKPGAWESVSHPQYWAFSATDDVWTKFPGSRVRTEDSCIAGDYLVALTSRYEYQGNVIDDDPTRHVQPEHQIASGPGNGFVEPSLRLLQLSAPGKGWSETPVAPEVKYNSPFVPRLECLERHAMITDQGGQGTFRLFDFDSQTWSTPAVAPQTSDAPTASIPTFSNAVWTGRELVFLPDDADLFTGMPGQAYDPSAGTWRLLPEAPGAGPDGAFWDGSAIFVYQRAIAAGQVGGDHRPAGVVRFSP